MENQAISKELIPVWEKIGKSNTWIKGAYDPPFDGSCIKICNSIEQLENYLRDSNFCLGQGFAFKNLCFIQQIDGGDEWLIIKDDFAFESYTFGGIIKRGDFSKYINAMLNAPLEACKSLNYMEYAQ